MSIGRPSDRAKAKAIEALQETPGGDGELVRVNFEVSPARKLRLRIAAAKANKTVKDFLTDFIDSLPEP